MNTKLKKVLATIAIVILTVGVMIGCGMKSESIKDLQNETSRGKYENSDYLVDIDWLQDNLKNDKLIIIDGRSKDDYDKGHIPGAINVAWQSLANMTGKAGDNGWGVILDENQLSEKFSQLGIKEDSIVVTYANKDGWGEDGRLAWMFKMTNIDSKMLNGGFDLWSEDGREVSKDAKEVKEKSNIKVTLNNDTTITTEDLKANYDKVKVVDSRATDEYEGATKFGESRGGHLKDAISLPFNRVYNQDGTIKTLEELEKIFESAGLSKDDEIITYCTAGIRSAHLQLMLKMCGYDKVKNYDASFYEWAADDSNAVEK